MIKRPARPEAAPGSPHRTLASAPVALRASLMGLCALIASLLWGGCPVNEPSFTLDLQIISPDGNSTTAMDKTGKIIRLSFLRPKLSTALHVINIRDHELICDRIILPGISVPFQVPNEPDPTVTLKVEVFSDDEAQTLIYSGMRRGVELTQETKSATILLYPAGGTVKTKGPAGTFRAFHTATLLPNGEVMLIGGMIADSPNNKQTTGQLQESAYASPSIEIYDPATLTFRDADDQLKIPRAFHQAHLLPSLPDGTHRVLVVGGVKPANEVEPAFLVRIKTVLPFLFTPTDTAEAAEAELVSYKPNTSPETRPNPPPEVTARIITEIPRTMFPAMSAAISQDRILFAGGGQAYATSGVDYGFTGYEATFWVPMTDQSPIHEDQQQLNQTRVGHAMAQLGDQYLVLGGNMSGGMGDIGERVLAGTPPLPVAITSPSATAWHTLTSIGASDRDLASNIAPTAALWAGGFGLADESENLRFVTTVPQAPPLQWIKYNELSFQDVPAPVFESVGYHDAIRLHDGSVLLSGGNCTTNTFCASQQLVICAFDGAPACAAAPVTLQTGRFGHRATRLLDNTVLFTGGINGGAAGQLLKDAEIFNPRAGHASEDYPFDRELAAGSETPCLDLQVEQ